MKESINFIVFFCGHPKTRNYAESMGANACQDLYLHRFEILFDNLPQSPILTRMKLKTSSDIVRTFTLEVFLETRDREVEISVEVGFEWQNDGIGAYEYWGDKGVDKGTDYLVTTEELWDSTGFDPNECEAIEAQIKASIEDWCIGTEKDLRDRCDD